MNTKARANLVQLIGAKALAAVEEFERDLPPGLAARFEHLVWTIDQGTADQCHVEEERVRALMRDHLAGGVWLELLRCHCEGSGDLGCCEHPGTPEQRLREDAGGR
jgi:hypothetical protein